LFSRKKYENKSDLASYRSFSSLGGAEMPTDDGDQDNKKMAADAKEGAKRVG